MSWTPTIAADALVEGAGTCVEADGTRIALFRVEGEIRAIGDRCSHAEASLSEGDVFDTEVECPRHGATFDLTTGEALTLPATRPVPTFPVRVVDGTVEVEVTA